MVICCVAAVPAAAGTLKTVRYRGYELRVPSSWPVFRLGSNPTACVRFNRHAVYLGRPSAHQRCPAHAVGRTEAVLLAPAAPAAAPIATDARRLQTAGTGELTVRGPRVTVTATWRRDRSVIARALGAGGLASGWRTTAATGPVLAPPALAREGLFHANALNVGGLGFDSCQAPSAAAMAAWLQYSPFRAAAIYIGGANSACAQPNLTASWVSAESAAGWQFIPTYVGLQAPTSSCGGCQTISSTQAAAQGTAAAIDAVAQAEALGIGAGNPIYNDMEAYTRTTSSTAAVQAFLSAWTAELHAYGYVSGVYAAGLSGIPDLIAAQSTTVGTTGFAEPDDIWIADWNNQASASDPYVPAAAWANNQRLHQYRGGHIDTYGGFKIDIDDDYLDGATATAGAGTAVVASLPDGTFVTYRGKAYRLAGGAPLLVHSWSAFGAQQPTVALSTAQWQALSTVPTDGTFVRTTGTSKVYRIAGGAPVPVRSWSVFGATQPAVVVDRWNILNAGNPSSHLTAVPRSGTIVQGLPSGQYWQFSAGWRALTSPAATAIAVPDTGLGSYLQAPAVSRDSLSGVAQRSAKLRIVLTAGANAPALKRFIVALPPGLSFSRAPADLTKGVVAWWTARGGPLTSSARLSHGKLTITLASPARKVLIALTSPALYTTRALAAAVKKGASAQALTLSVSDSQRHLDVLTLTPTTS